MKRNHLVILKRLYVEAILEGRKTIESRFTMNRRAYWRKILYGDRLFIKQSSGPVCATAKVTKVRYYEGLTAEKIERLKIQYNRQILGTDEYWKSKSNCRYGVMVWVSEAKPIEPILINKRDWRAWVVLSEKEHFGLLKQGQSKAGYRQLPG
jgi:ASC-1-like (ASCH) protein